MGQSLRCFPILCEFSDEPKTNGEKRHHTQSALFLQSIMTRKHNVDARTANISIGSTWAGHFFSVKITFILV